MKLDQFLGQLELQAAADKMSRVATREEFWQRICLAVAASSNASDKEAMVRWADYALRERDKRFAGG